MEEKRLKMIEIVRSDNIYVTHHTYVELHCAQYKMEALRDYFVFHVQYAPSFFFSTKTIQRLEMDIGGATNDALRLSWEM